MNVDHSTLDRESWLREESTLSSFERFLINVSKLIRDYLIDFI